MASPAQSASPNPRLRTTPYARRLARERGLVLDAIAGTGPDGRITGTDVMNFRLAQSAAAPAPEPAPALKTPASGAAPSPSVAVTPPQVPAALVVQVDFGPARNLLAQVSASGLSISHENIALKAAAASLALLEPEGKPALLVRHGRDAVHLADLRHVSLSGIAARREAGGGGGEAALAVSFLARPGVRPVAARLANDAPARLVVGFPDGENRAECLLAYDPERIEDDAAADFLAMLKAWIETPLRLLV